MIPDIQPARYADQEGLESMLNSIPLRAWRGWPHPDHNPYFDLTPRLVAADYLQDLGRDREARLLRDTTQHIYRDENGEIGSAGDISRERRAMAVRPGHGAAANLAPEERELLDHALYMTVNPDTGEDFLGDSSNAHAIHPDTIASMLADWRHFKGQHQAPKSLPGISASFGPEESTRFWLSRNGHGTGFFDSEDMYGPEYAQHLQDAAGEYGEYGLYVGGDGLIHGDYESPPTDETPPEQFARYGRTNYADQGDHQSFQEAINNGDLIARKVYADYLEENGDAERWVTHLLRHHDGQLHVRSGEDGRPTLNFVKNVDPGVVNRRGLPTRIEFTDGRLSMTGKTGQTIMQFREYDPRGHLSIRDVAPRKGWTPKLVRQLHDVWDRWHLNDMKAGTSAQEEYLRANPIHVTYPAGHFDAAVAALTAAGLNPDPTTGHRYGYAWLREEVPPDVLHFLATLPGPHVPKPRTPKPPPTQAARYGRISYTGPLDPDEQAAFEAAIDDNPLEALTHGAYADWLQDRGHEDEAAFRRAMGDFVRDHGHRIYDGRQNIAWNLSHYLPYPEGVSPENIPVVPPQRVYLMEDQDGDTYQQPDAQNGEGFDEHGHDLTWRTYRDMEEGLRRAFLKGRQNPPTQAARYERRNAPVGFDYNDRPYRKGQFIPGTVLFQHTPAGSPVGKWRPEAPPEVQPAGLVEYGETTEDSFHQMLDENLDDYQTRTVFADWLHERDDPRAEGYRALGMLRKNPRQYKPYNSAMPETWYWGHTSNENYNNRPDYHPSLLDHDWMERVVPSDPARAHLTDGDYWRYHQTRRQAEDAAAVAFAQLTPERRAEILAAANPPEQLSRYDVQPATYDGPDDVQPANPPGAAQNPDVQPAKLPKPKDRWGRDRTPGDRTDAPAVRGGNQRPISTNRRTASGLHAPVQ
jgi:uncharacterized protein (TIGR02996 family)